MISEKIAEKLNKQLNVELFAYYQYLAMSAYCETKAMNGFANWFALQSEEERAHAMKIYRYLLDQDAEVNLLPIEQPKKTFSTLLACMEDALAHEQHVTKCINDLAGAAMSESDHATHIFLHWFVTEQVEEEASVRDIVDRLKLTGDSAEGKLMLDRDLAARTPESE